jgi:hypothetical protein
MSITSEPETSFFIHLGLIRQIGEVRFTFIMYRRFLLSAQISMSCF